MARGVVRFAVSSPFSRLVEIPLTSQAAGDRLGHRLNGCTQMDESSGHETGRSRKTGPLPLAEPPSSSAPLANDAMNNRVPTISNPGQHRRIIELLTRVIAVS